MSEGRRRLAAIMFTDMVGYTALGQKNESLSLALVEEQRKLVRPIIGRHNGREVKTMGDAFLVEFPSALDAVRCAYDIQRGAREFNLSLPEDRRVHLRIGVHLGDVTESEGDISGDAVNVASRIEPLAEDGGVCISRQVYDHVQNKTDLQLLSIGPKSLKNVVAPVEVYRMVMPWEQGDKAPGDLDKRRIAVLPFTNMSPDPNDAYFADGMTEELITTLSKAGELTLIGRTSVMQYKNTTKRISSIAQDLGTGTLIEGSVRKAASKVRITIQVLDGRTENHIWAENYDRDLNDIFEIQSDVAKKVTDALKIKLLPSERQEIERRPTLSKEAHTLFLKGRYHWNERTPKSLQVAAEYFEKAIQEDPSFALAYVGLADTYTVLSDQGVMNALEGGQKVREFAEKALELDPSLAEAHATLANVLAYVFWEWPRAELEFRRSIELNPAYPTARQWYGKILSFLGRYDEAVQQHAKALELDPFSLIINTNYGEALVEAGRYAEGIQQGLRTTALDPDFAIGHFEFGIFYLGGREFAKAEGEFKRTLEIVPEFPAAISMLAYTYGLAGRRVEGEEKLAQLQELASKRFVDPADIGIAEFGLGKEEDAFRHLEEAYETRSSWLLYFKAFPAFERLRVHPKFVAILLKMGLGAS